MKIFREFGTLTSNEIFKRVGVKERRIRGVGEIGSDLAFKSSQLLFEEHGIDKKEIDFYCFALKDWTIKVLLLHALCKSGWG